MKFIHDQKIIDAYPHNYTGIITVKNFNDPALLERETEALKEKIENVMPTDDMQNAISKWQETFAKMGAKKKYKSSLTAAHDFYKDNNRLYKINPIVDFYNHYCLAHMVPMGAYDLTKITGNLHLTLAEKGMEFIGIGGKDIQKTKENEVIYKDESRVTCKYWNLKDSDQTKIADETHNIIFMFDIIKQSADQASQTFEKMLQDFKNIFGETFDKSGLTGKDLEASIESLT